MVRKKEIVAMLLAGGQGSRLEALTKKIAKPAVSFGAKYRIIDFSLSNCANSQIDTVGVLTQYKPLLLNSYMGNGSSWDLDISGGGLHVLQPYETEDGGSWYRGTADAIYRNIDFISKYDPEYVLIISGDHLYKMNYQSMLDFHKEKGADLTIATIDVSIEEASRFGILSADGDRKITKFSEKPKKPESTLASMGIYIFNWSVLRQALIEDSEIETSAHDFGKNIIPTLLSRQSNLYAYVFDGYWKDVGTIDSYFGTNMELLESEPPFDIFSNDLRIFSNSNIQPPHFLGADAKLENCLVANGSTVLGHVKHSIISSDVFVDEGAQIIDAILLPGARVGKNTTVTRAIIGEETEICDNLIVGNSDPSSKITVLGNNEIISKSIVQ